MGRVLVKVSCKMGGVWRIKIKRRQNSNMRLLSDFQTMWKCESVKNGKWKMAIFPIFSVDQFFKDLCKSIFHITDHIPVCTELFKKSKRNLWLIPTANYFCTRDGWMDWIGHLKTPSTNLPTFCFWFYAVQFCAWFTGWVLSVTTKTVKNPWDPFWGNLTDLSIGKV